MLKVLGSFVITALIFGACTTTSKTVSGSSPKTETTKASGGDKKMVDAAKSEIWWEGVKTDGAHSGTLRVSEGYLEMKGETVTGGSFTIDMNSIEVGDLEGDSKTDLENHLKADHFFKVKDFPNATFDITKVEEASEGEYTHLVTGDLKILGISKSVAFETLFEDENGGLRASTKQFTIDRTLWGITYSSKIQNDFNIKLTMFFK